MPAVLHVGPFLLQTQWLIIILSALIGYIVMRYRLKTAASLAKQMSETIENSIIIALLTWKLSLLLFDPVSVVTNPLALLYFSGGVRGVWLAAVLVIFYIYQRAKKEHVSVWIYGDLLATGFLAATTIYHLLELFGDKQRVWVEGSQILIALLFLLIVWRSKAMGKPHQLSQVLLWFSLGQVFIAFLNPFKQNDWRGFSQEQLFYLCLAALSFSLNFILEKIFKKSKAC